MKTHPKNRFQAALTALLLSVLACTSGTPTPSFDEISTIVASTYQAMTAAAPSPQPTATVAPPTATSALQPSAPSVPAGERLNFATGSTAVVVEDAIQAGETLNYVVRALQDQPAIVMLDSPNHDLILSISGANGVVLLPFSQGESTWQGLLPATQDYVFKITGSGSTQNFMLHIIIAARIQFAAGQDQVVRTGQTVAGNPTTYVARASAGQDLHVSVNTAPEVAALTIWGFSDGEPYARAQNGVVDFNMTLPSTQDYIIQVVPQGGQVVNYTLTVKID